MKDNLLSRTFLLFLLLLFVASAAFAQTSRAEPEMADTLRASGKIYVVVMVLVIIVTGLLMYLVRLDVKISYLEEKIQRETE